jgi:uncharacterized protein
MVARRMTLLCFVWLAFFAPAWAQSDEQAPLPLEFLVEMRDGVKLATSVYLPDGDGPWPVVLTRTPYNKAGYAGRAPLFTGHDYAFVAQDCRGRFLSEGEYVPFTTDMEDGYDTVEWLAAQDFCNGKVGITGASAMGITSNLAAAADPPHLIAAYVTVAPQSLFYESRFMGGVFKEAHAGGWMRSQGVPEQIPEMKKRVVMDEEWKRTDLIHHLHNIDIPIYNVAGWYDIFVEGGLRNFQYLQNSGREGARGNQKILIGPFGHGSLSGDLAYPEAGGGLRDEGEVIRWFDYWLKGIDNGIIDDPPVTYYMMADAMRDDASEVNRWLTSDSWPPASTPTRFYLGDGMELTTAAPDSDESYTEYFADPSDPIPTYGGQNLRLEKGPMDQRPIGERGDYLRFETKKLKEDVVIAGKVDMELYAATDGFDTDFMVKLVDVYPDGYEAIVLDCPLRARYRNGRTREDVKMMSPRQPEKLDIDLWSTAITFEKGHKIAVHISSSNYPRFEVNPNTGDPPGMLIQPPRIAHNTIYHDAERPSAIILPVIE